MSKDIRTAGRIKAGIAEVIVTAAEDNIPRKKQVTILNLSEKPYDLAKKMHTVQLTPQTNVEVQAEFDARWGSPMLKQEAERDWQALDLRLLTAMLQATVAKEHVYACAYHLPCLSFLSGAAGYVLPWRVPRKSLVHQDWMRCSPGPLILRQCMPIKTTLLYGPIAIKMRLQESLHNFYNTLDKFQVIEVLHVHSLELDFGRHGRRCEKHAPFSALVIAGIMKGTLP